MKNESMFFADYLSSLSAPTLSIKEAFNPNLNIDSLNDGDLLMVMYYGDDHQAIHALKLLRQLFDDELQALEQLNYQDVE